MANTSLRCISICNDGWKTYWRAPGDAGIPPGNSSGRGRATCPMLHVSRGPRQNEILQSGVQTIGYEDAVTLPLTLTPARAGQIDLI